MDPKKIRAIVVDDSNFMVTIFKDILETHDDIIVVGTGKNGLDAIELNHRLNPDVILMDIEMPKMDGLTAVKKIMEKDPTPVVIISGIDDRSGLKAVEALEAGAVEFIPKTSGSLSLDIRLKSEKIIQSVITAASTNDTALATVLEQKPSSWDHIPVNDGGDLIVIASSTGGTRALDIFLSNLPKNFPVPIVVVQHMPEKFTAYLARNLNKKIDLPVKEAKNGEEISENQVYIIPSGFHGKVNDIQGRRYIGLDGNTPRLHGLRPAADYLFQSAAEVFGVKLVGIVFTGMGKDGAYGSKIIKEQGGFIAVQDKKSSVIHSMPKSAKDMAGCDFEGAPTDIAKTMVDMFMRGM